MRTHVFCRAARLWVVLTAVVGLLGLAVSTGWAGMAQQSPVFRAKGRALDEAMVRPGAPVPGGYPYSATAPGPNLQIAAPAGQPSPVTREKTDVSLVMVAKYGDEKDEDLRKYEATFKGEYRVRNKDEKEKVTVNIYFPFPSTADTLPDVNVMVGDHEPDGVKYTKQGVGWESEFGPGQVKEITVTYRAFGTEDFAYMLDRDERIKQFKFALTVSGTERKPELPARLCLDPSTPLEKGTEGWTATWDYKNLLSTRDIVIVIPPRFMGSNVFQRVQRLTWAAVASVLLFGLILFTGGAASRKSVSVGQYMLVVLALAVFYPLFLYLSKHLRVAPAFWLSYAAIGLLILYSLARGQGLRFALGYGGFGLVLLPGLFTAAALATKGAAALVMVGLLLLVGYVIVVAPKIAAARPPRPVPPPAPRPPSPPSVPEVGGVAEGEAPAGETVPSVPVPAGPTPTPVEPEGPVAFCVYCGEALAEEFCFCPHCGKGAEITVKCDRCGNALCLEPGTPYQYCPGCGRRLARPARPATDAPAPTGE